MADPHTPPAWRSALRCVARGVLALAGVAATAGCGGTDTSRFPLVVIGEAEDPFRTSGEGPLAGQLTRAATAEGLVAFDEQGRVVPALADRWIVTDDGKSYLFRLRDGEWRNGDPLTARSAKAALDAALRDLRGTPLALDFAPLEEVRVMAGRVIEIRLYRPMPFFLQLLAQPELGLLHAAGKARSGSKGRVDQGDGPMIVEREGALARFVPIEPSRLGLPEVPDWDSRTRQIEMRALPAAAAVKRFNDGEADLVVGGRFQDFPLTASVGILRGTIQLDPVMGLFGLQVVAQDGFLADPQNREALAMAIDRPGLIAPFGVSGWTPSNRLLASGLDIEIQTNGERWSDVPLEARRAAAAAQVRTWRGRGAEASRSQPGRDGAASEAAPEPPAPAKVSVWLPAGPGSDILFERLAADFRTIGVASDRARTLEDADLRLVDEVARYPRARWFLNRLSCTARIGQCDNAADELVAGAVRLEDAGLRSVRFGEAEARLTAANTFIPFGPPIRWSLVRGNVHGFATNAWAWHPLMPLAWLHR